jgi:glycogenin
VKTQHQIVILITPGVSASMRTKLEDSSSPFDMVKLVDVLDSGDTANLSVLKRPELGITFTKLNCWKLTQFEKCVFLDADVLVRNSCILYFVIKNMTITMF